MAVQIQAFVSSCINYAMQQNKVPVLSELKILSDEALEDITLKITMDNGLAEPLTINIERLRAGEACVFARPDFIINGLRLASFTEKLESVIHVVLENSEAIELAKQSYPVTVLAYDEWSGVANTPELICSFVMPNAPVITSILKRASEILMEYAGTSNLSGYLEANPDLVKKQAAAVYAALQELDIAYRVLPASFEEAGQRVKTCDYIVANKLANCIEMTCLYCSCLEAIGLNTGLVFFEGHVLSAIWTINESFADVVSDEIERINKRTAEGINQMLLVEATLMCSGVGASFDKAMLTAMHEIQEKPFKFFVDVHRSRVAGIRPLPQLIANENGGLSLVEDSRIDAELRKPTDIVELKALERMNEEGLFTRNRLWENSLLDLSLNNRLLNISSEAYTVPVAIPNLSSLEDYLAQGESFKIQGFISDNVEMGINGQYVLNEIDKANITAEIQDSHIIHSFLGEEELRTKLEFIAREARVSNDENGANSLFLSLGFLKWYETPVSPNPRYAPILLLPVELSRQTANSAFVLKGRDEATIINYSLIEMLRQSYGIDLSALNTLPKDDSGIDVPLVFATIRHAIMDTPRWDVEESTLIGNYSFRKFLMWNDIHKNNQLLRENIIYKALLNGSYQNTASSDLLYSRNSIDERIKYGDLCLPIAADASQLEAIYLADQGQSFILQGPPGTGKSQTITNIIANALSKGKKVLFVAEKIEALRVVQERLDKLGLNQFCLELHSNKTCKKQVLESLEAGLEVTALSTEGEEYADMAAELLRTREELNAEVEAIHTPYLAKLSLYDALNEIINSGVVVEGRFDEEIIAKLTAENIRVARKAARELSLVATTISNVDNHPLREICACEVHAELRGEKFEYVNERFDGVIEQLTDGVKKLGEKFNIKAWLNNYNSFNSLNEFLIPACRLTLLNSYLLAQPNYDEFATEIDQIITNSMAYQANTINLGSHAAELIALDLESIKQTWDLDEAKSYVFRLLGHGKQVKLFEKILTDEVKVTAQNFPQLLKYALTAKGLYEKLLTRLAAINGLDSELEKLIINAPDKAKDILKDNNAFMKSLKMLGNEEVESNIINTVVVGLRAEGNSFIDNIFSMISSYKQPLSSFNLTLNELLDILKFDEQMAPKDFIGFNNMLKRWGDNFASLHDWTQYNRALKRLIDSGFKKFTDLLRYGDVHAENAQATLTSMICCSYIDFIVAKVPQLAGFKGLVFSDRINGFSELLTKFRELSSELLKIRLHNNRITGLRDNALEEQYSYLMHAIKSQGGNQSLRTIFEGIADILPCLQPCMLMSPISVAQYLNPEKYSFDLVIFDEASQIPTAEAVGAIGRGKQLIVVGDPKQLPPLDFFSAKNNEDEEFSSGSLESIMDDCEALMMPVKSLAWHYRSRHESLIAFSNNNYYDGNLLTFPSPGEQENMVKLVEVDGVYDSVTGCNRIESLTVVDFISDFLSMPEYNQTSIGVVTFNSRQQVAIENDLDRLYRARPELEQVAQNLPKPIFIKNFENVQGDERDIIIFSVGFGKDKNGRVSRNLGALNRVGGERGLNVAVTRARQQMLVFSSLKAEDLQVTSSSAEGVIGLYNFLSYAQKGKDSLGRTCKLEVGIKDSLHLEIAAELAKNGYSCDVDIGSSSYRIDIAIKDPNNTDKYLACILTDGYSYRDIKSAYDRNLGQVQVLKNLGWRVIRLWTLDWWQNKQEALAQLLKQLAD